VVDSGVFPPPTAYIGLCLIKFGKFSYVIFKFFFRVQLKYHGTGGELKIDPRWFNGI